MAATGAERLCTVLNLSELEWHPLTISFLKGEDLDAPNEEVSNSESNHNNTCKCRVLRVSNSE
jgi:hypothetical protein